MVTGIACGAGAGAGAGAATGSVRGGWTVATGAAGYGGLRTLVRRLGLRHMLDPALGGAPGRALAFERCPQAVGLARRGVVCADGVR